MKHSYNASMLFLLLLCTASNAQEIVPQPAWWNQYNVSFSGFISNHSFYDSRQVIVDEETLSEVLPRHRFYDANGNDINSKDRIGSSSTETRVDMSVRAPDIGNFTPELFVSSDFIGLSFTIDHFRLRQAYVHLYNENISFLAGQAWHPMFSENCYPRVLSYNCGRPMEPIARAPQIRCTYTNGSITCIAMAATQIDFISTGPQGDSSIYIRRAILPNLHAQVFYKDDLNTTGVGIDFVRIVPRVKTEKNIKNIEKLFSVSAIAYTSFTWNDIIASLKFTYGQNDNEYNMLGGYAVHSIDHITDARTYTNLHNVSLWFDFTWNKKFEPGIFIGGTKNLGALKSIIPSRTREDGTTESLIYAFQPDVDTVFRIAPRLRMHFDPFVAGIELEYTRATYGTITTSGKVVNADPLYNLRILFVFHYYF